LIAAAIATPSRTLAIICSKLPSYQAGDWPAAAWERDRRSSLHGIPPLLRLQKHR
jgi:hypothetical protein